MEKKLSQVRKNIQVIESQIAPFGTKLLPVTKTFGIDKITEAYESGYRAFGENKVQELIPKYESLPKDIEWHLIGHLQSNKVKYIAPFIACIQSVDSEKLLSEINRQGEKLQRKISCLLQVYIASEETKFGWDPAELLQNYKNEFLNNYPWVFVDGLMGMASNSRDSEKVSDEFHELKILFEELKTYTHLENSNMKILSMGMSGDYLLACKEGSSMIRLGSSIFGTR